MLRRKRNKNKKKNNASAAAAAAESAVAANEQQQQQQQNRLPWSENSDTSLGIRSVGSHTDVSSLTRDTGLFSTGSRPSLSSGVRLGSVGSTGGGTSSSFNWRGGDNGSSDNFSLTGSSLGGSSRPSLASGPGSFLNSSRIGGGGGGGGDGSNGSGENARNSISSGPHSVVSSHRRSSVGLSDRVVTESERKKQKQLGTLRFDRLEIFGRDEEKKQLKDALEHVVSSRGRKKSGVSSNESSVADGSKRTLIQTNVQSQSRSAGNGLVLIGGESGVGKTTLCKYVQRAVKKSNGLYVMGKFDMTTIGQPFAGIKAACLQICGELMHQKLNHPTRWSKIVRNLITIPELGLIFQLIPDLQDCLLDDQSQDEDRQRVLDEAAQRSSSFSTDDRASAKLYESFRRFIRVISTNFKPFVMTLDDLQRADNGSLQLVQSIVSDISGSGLLVVGTYRSNEIDDEMHPMHRFIEEVSTDPKKEDSGLQLMKQIQLSNFDEAKVKEILVVVLNLNGDEKDLDTLASLCYKRTMGNMFYLERFLQTIKDDSLIQFNVALWNWQWDIESIAAYSEASDNVVDLMRSQLLTFPAAVQKRLSVAAFLGSTFDTETEQIVWDAVVDDDEDTNGWLEMSESRGILEGWGDTHYRWAHDQVQSSARLLVPEEEVRSLKSRMARALLDGLSEDRREFYTFTIVDLLSSDDDSHVEPNLEVAMLNRSAAKKAAALVGLESMRHYAVQGLKYLPDDSLNNAATYKISLDLVSFATEAASLLSDEGLMSLCMKKIDLLSDRPLMDKMRSYKAWIKYHVRQKDDTKNSEGLAFTINVLRQLGVKFPKGKMRQLVSLLTKLSKVKSTAKRITVEEVLNDTRPVDPVDYQALQLLVLAMESCFLTQPDLLPLWLLQIAELAFRNGICEYTQAAYAQLGMVFRLVKEYNLATKMAIITERLLQQFNFSETRGGAMYLIYSFPLSYTRPCHEVVGGLLESYSHSLAVGDLSGVGSSLVFLGLMQFTAGTNLKLMNSDCRRYVYQLHELKNEQAELNARSIWQCVQNLLGLGESDDPCALVGSALSEANAQSITLESGKFGLHYMPCYLCAVFGKYEKGSQIAKENMKRFEKALSGAGISMHWTFVAGVNHFAMARKTRKRKYIKEGKKVLSTIRGWAKNDNPNVLHYLHLFEAEMAALRGKLDASEVLYHKAIAISRRSGFIHDAAIINERLASFFLHHRKSNDDAYYQMLEACKLYEEWGCYLKVEMLKKEYRSVAEENATPRQTVVAIELH